MLKDKVWNSVSALVLVGVFLFLPTQTNVQPAQAITSGVTFAGAITEFVPPTPECPIAHTVVFDITGGGEIGLAVEPGSQIYLYGNLATPGTLTMGTFIPLPQPCITPYPIFPISIIGTSE